MRIAHFSDLHVLDLAGVSAARLWTNKRATGMVNLKLHRGHKHKPRAVEAIVDDIRGQGVDHVVITGDLSNLALETEFSAVRAMIDRLGMPADRVSVVPGNHDVYTRGSARARRFQRAFEEYMRGDPALAAAGRGRTGPFPFVRVRGPAAFIGLSSAVPRPPGISAGHVGPEQTAALEGLLLREPALAGLVPVVLMHHPVINPRGGWRTFSRGLAEADPLRALLGRREGDVLFLHGHLHERGHRRWLGAGGGTVHHLGATSASLLHAHPDRAAGYNLYDIEPRGLTRVFARVYDDRDRVLRDAQVTEKSTDFAD
jgi:3',5'-cyclic AMP phosphodiesterase CpdA